MVTGWGCTVKAAFWYVHYLCFGELFSSANVHLKSKKGKYFVDHFQASFSVLSRLEKESSIINVEDLVNYKIDASSHALSGVAGELSFLNVCDVLEFSLGDVV